MAALPQPHEAMPRTKPAEMPSPPETRTLRATPAPAPRRSPAPVARRAIQPDLFDSHSDELEDIIGYAPGWLIRWGISAISLAMLILLAISWFVKYPELVRGQMTVTTPKPPIRVVAAKGGEIESLLVKDGDPITEGAPLALLESTAELKSVLDLVEQLHSFEADLSQGDVSRLVDHLPTDEFIDSRLGPIQGPHSAFLKSISDHMALVDDNYYRRKIRVSEAQVSKHLELREAIRSRLSLSRQQLELAERSRGRHFELAKKGLLSEIDREKIESEYLEMKSTHEANVRDLASSGVRLTEYRSSLLDLRHQSHEARRRSQLALRGRIHDLRDAIQVWKQEYLFSAPVSGKVSFLRVLDEGHYVAPGEPVFAVVPEGSPASVRMRLSQAGAGRVKVGQAALLRFDGYPSNEFGTVRGIVESISLVPSRQLDTEGLAYLVGLSLPEGLLTSYGRQLDFRQEMGGSAEIVTEDLRLLERLFYRLRDIGRTTRAL